MLTWKKKLASRKFWVCVCGFVTAVMTAFRLSGGAAQTTAVIMAFGTLISYILAEGAVDASAAGSTADSAGKDEESGDSSGTAAQPQEPAGK